MTSQLKLMLFMGAVLLGMTWVANWLMHNLVNTWMVVILAIWILFMACWCTFWSYVQNKMRGCYGDD